MIEKEARRWFYIWTEPPFMPLAASLMLVTATARLAHTLTCIGALAWVFLLTRFVCILLKKALPRFGRNFIIIFLAALIASLYYLLLYIANPVLAFECSLPIAFTPAVFCICDFEWSRKPQKNTLHEMFYLSFELLIPVFAVMTGIALIREPLGYACLSIPGGREGIIKLANWEGGSLFSIQIISQPAGAFILLGYMLALFRHINRSRDTGIHPEYKETLAAVQKNDSPVDTQNKIGAAKPPAPNTAAAVQPKTESSPKMPPLKQNEVKK
ncbi:MAG: hypothetical protein LBG74_01410 [Spirochaetaceae bacterium]|jgi:hypothetical protein|nr:hypothetical protein [Spirochaetaceae bacterium]